MGNKLIVLLSSLMLITSCKKDKDLTVQDLLDKGTEISTILNDYPADSLLGKEHEGGWIYYVNETEGTAWVVSNMNTQAVWGCAGNEILGADSVAVGAGKSNTDDIMAECPDASAAAGYCSHSNHIGFTDWVFPSLNDMYFVHQNVHQQGIGNFSSTESYWTSTEIDAINAWCLDFITGDTLVSNKTNTFNVRAVRKSTQ